MVKTNSCLLLLGVTLLLWQPAAAQETAGGTDLTWVLSDSASLRTVVGNMGAHVCEEATPLNVGALGSSAYLFTPGTSLGAVEAALSTLGVGAARAAQVGEFAADALRTGGKAVGLVAAAGAFYMFLFTDPDERAADCRAQLGRIVGYPVDLPGLAPLPSLPSTGGPGEPADQPTIDADTLATKLATWATSASP